jgi:hypothetical protein
MLQHKCVGNWVHVLQLSMRRAAAAAAAAAAVSMAHLVVVGVVSWAPRASVAVASLMPMALCVQQQCIGQAMHEQR